MGVEIAITVAREETRVAVLDNGVVTDLFGDRAKHKDFVGNIYKGKVAKVLPGMQAAFVDIGLEKNGFLHVDEIVLPGVDAPRRGRGSGSGREISELLKPGQEIVVHVSATVGLPLGTSVTVEGDATADAEPGAGDLP